MSNIQTEIAAINAKFDQAFNGKNVQEIGRLYDENAIVMPAPAGEPVVGRVSIENFFTGLIDAGVIEHALVLGTVVEEGNLAYQLGQWSGAMVDAQGEKQTFGGNVQMVYRKQADGNWKTVTHIWN